MTVKEMKELLDKYPDTYTLWFLCPDGFEDQIVSDYHEVSHSYGVIAFLSYVHQARRKEDESWSSEDQNRT